MASARRLTRLERELDADAALRHWLAEAKGFPDLAAYTRWVFEQPEGQGPFDRLRERVEAATRKRERGRPAVDVKIAVANSTRQALVGARIVVQLNIEAADQLVTGGLTQGLLMFWLRELLLREELAEQGEAEAWLADEDGLEPSWSHWREAAGVHLVGLHHAALARGMLEERHLRDHASLLPTTAEGWRDLVERSEGLYEAAATLWDGDAFESLEAIRERATEGAEVSAVRIVGMASLQTYWAMGDRRNADAAVQALLGQQTMP